MQPVHKAWQAGVEWSQLDRHGEVDAFADRFHDVQGRFLDCIAGVGIASRREIKIEFQGIRSGGLDQLGILDPGSHVDTVQAGEDRQVDGFLQLLDMLQIGFRMKRKPTGLRINARVRVLEIRKPADVLADNLFLKEGMHDNGRSARILELLDRIQVINQW